MVCFEGCRQRKQRVMVLGLKRNYILGPVLVKFQKKKKKKKLIKRLFLTQLDIWMKMAKSYKRGGLFGTKKSFWTKMANMPKPEG